MTEKNLNILQILKLILRIAIGALFITSAILKMLSLDTFELYIYSFNIVGFSLSAVAARCVIASELLVGALLISKIRYREAWWFALLMLIGFTFLLIYVVIFRNDQNCHCLGDIVEMKPSLSIVKNLVTIALLFLTRNENDYQFKGKTIVFSAIVVLALTAPFVLFPTDDVYNIFQKESKSFDETAFNSFVDDSLMQNINIDDGNYIIGVISSGCEFCRISGIKISEIVENNNLDSNNVLFWIWGEEKSVENFKKDTKTEKFQFITIDPMLAIRISNGRFPVYLFVKDGEVVKTGGLRQLTEKDVINHLNN